MALYYVSISVSIIIIYEVVRSRIGVLDSFQLARLMAVMRVILILTFPAVMLRKQFSNCDIEASSRYINMDAETLPPLGICSLDSLASIIPFYLTISLHTSSK